jgi:two-component system response regulator HydG
MQPKLLRVLQESELRPLGGRRSLTVDVRVISATNRSLRELVREGRFREDLFYRLNVLRVVMPPLRERREDIPLLIEHFLRLMAKSRGGVRMAVDDAVMGLFVRYDWPGNVRELENILSRLSVACRGNRITRPDLESDPDLGRSFGPLLEPPPVDSLRDLEGQQIRRALDKTAGNREQAARLLGISRATIFRKIREYRIG